MNLGELENTIADLHKLKTHITKIKKEKSSFQIKNVAFITLGATSATGLFLGAFFTVANYASYTASITTPAIITVVSTAAFAYLTHQALTGISAENHINHEIKESEDKYTEIETALDNREVLVSDSKNVVRLNPSEIKKTFDTKRIKAVRNNNPIVVRRNSRF